MATLWKVTSIAMTTDTEERGLNQDEKDRLWQHRLAVGTNFNNFVNFFLVSESVLLAVVGMFSGKSIQYKSIQVPIIFLGLILTLIWFFVQGKQNYILEIIKKRCEIHLLEYKETRSQRNPKKWRFSNGIILAYCLPVLFALTWVIVLIAIIKNDWSFKIG